MKWYGTADGRVNYVWAKNQFTFHLSSPFPFFLLDKRSLSETSNYFIFSSCTDCNTFSLNISSFLSFSSEVCIVTRYYLFEYHLTMSKQILPELFQDFFLSSYKIRHLIYQYMIHIASHLFACDSDRYNLYQILPDSCWQFQRVFYIWISIRLANISIHTHTRVRVSKRIHKK